MSSPQDSSSLQPVWDGYFLRLQCMPGSVIGVAIDGSRFIDMASDDDGLGRLELAFSPSGNAHLDLCITAPDNESMTWGIELGQPGLHEIAAGPRALRHLGAAEQLVPIDATPMRREVVIVVPVYNAAEDVERCLDSVLVHTTGRNRLIVIDDASTDPRITPLLDRYRGINGVEILSNPDNLGFTATVNRGIALAGQSDVVLLNADTEVAAHWLTGLRRALHSRDDVATVTAVSDNAGAFSVPELEQENPLPEEWTFADAARALWQSAGHAYPQLPTGNGFCMLIRRQVIDAIGALDVEAFPQGYGEENDFCQRASAAGYRHLIAGNVLVRHARSRSFGHERRQQLGHAGMQVLRERWPNYERDVGRMLFSFERRVLDWRVRRLHAEACHGKPQIRMLVTNKIGGLDTRPGYDCIPLDTLIATRMLESSANPHGNLPDAITAADIADFLQRHAIECVELDSDETAIGQLLRDQAQRLGIPTVDSSRVNLPWQETARSFIGGTR